MIVFLQEVGNWQIRDNNGLAQAREKSNGRWGAWKYQVSGYTENHAHMLKAVGNGKVPCVIDSKMRITLPCGKKITYRHYNH